LPLLPRRNVAVRFTSFPLHSWRKCGERPAGQSHSNKKSNTAPAPSVRRLN
jgi:hypothetical protein